VDYVADALIIFNAKFLLFANITNIKKIEKIETIIAGVAKAGFLAKSVVEALLTLSEQQVPLTRRIINAFVKVEDAKNLAKALISLHENGIDLTEHVVNSVAEAEYFSLHAARALIKVKKAGIPLANNNIRMITEAGKDAHNFANCLIGNLNNNVVVRPPVASPPKENEVEHKRSCSPGSR
jgi:ethanolamine utilization protein EutA (predicted chaperonin)